MKKLIKTISIILAIFSFALLTALLAVDHLMPDKFLLTEGERLVFNTKIPLSASEQTTQFAKQASVQAGNHFQTNLKLFGFVPVKEITVDVVKQK